MKGGIMEAFGKLFYDNLKLYIYPALKDDDKEFLTTKNIPIDKELEFLYKHLVDNRMIVDVPNADRDTMKIYSREVFNLIQAKDDSWESMVPGYVANIIRKRELFCKR
jgi:hypothetical protein